VDLDALAALERAYRPGRYSGSPVVLYRTVETARFSGSASLGWDRHVDGPFDVVKVPGDHTSMLLDENVEAIGEDLRARLTTLRDAPA
jgi:thioesterase domain-containing protein